MKLVVFALIFALCLSITSSTKVPAQEVIDTIEGILVGAFGEVGKEARDCLNDGEESFKHIGSAIQYFKNGTVVSIIYGISEIGKALELLPNELKDCKNLPELVKDFEKIAAEFKDPKNLTIHVGKEILFNGKSIYNDITNCIKNFETEKFEPAGENIGDIVYILFIKDDIVRGRLEATQFVEGFFKGALKDEAIEINECIDDGNKIIDALEKIIEDFKKGMMTDVEAILLHLIDLLSEIPKSILECEVVPKDITKLEDWALQMKDLGIMEKRLFNTFLNYSDRIKTNTKGLIEDYSRKLYRNSGNYLGDILYVIFELVQPTSNKNGLISDLIKN